MDVLQYIIDYQVRLKEQADSFLTDGGQKLEKWDQLKKTLYSKSKIDRDYLFPEVAELSNLANSTVKKSIALLAKVDDLLERADVVMQKGDQVSFLELVVSIKLALTVYFDFIQKEMLPIIRSKMPTYVREELSEVLDDMVNEDIESGVALYA